MEKFKLISTLFISILLIFSGCNVETDTTQSGQIINTESQPVTFSNTNANFTMIDISFTDGRTDDSIILGEEKEEVPYPTTVKPFRLAMYETSYNTWYEVLTWAEENGYTIVNKGVEGVFGEVEHKNNMSEPGAEPKLVEMPVCRLTWRDVMVWCNALSEMKGLEPVYCTDKDFKIPLRDSTGVAFNDLKNYKTEPGEVDNPYVNTNANGFRLPYVKEWEYAARKRLDGTAISGRNVSGDDTGSAIATTATEQRTDYRFLCLQNKTNIAGKGKTALQTDLQKLTQDKMIQTQRFQKKQENPSLEEECIFQVENFQIIQDFST